MRHYEFHRLSLKLAFLGEGWMETTPGTSAAALALTACPELTEHLRLETEYFSNFRALHKHYNLPCHSCFQLTLTLRSACKSLALKHTRISWVKVETADRQTQSSACSPAWFSPHPLWTQPSAPCSLPNTHIQDRHQLQHSVVQCPLQSNYSKVELILTI